MKNKIFLLVLSAVFLASCNNSSSAIESISVNPSSPSVSEPVSVEESDPLPSVSENESIEPIPSVSEEPSCLPSEEPSISVDPLPSEEESITSEEPSISIEEDYEKMSIYEASQKALALTNFNSAHIAISEKKVEISGKFLSVNDVVTTAGDFGVDYRYKLFFVDDTGYIFVSVDSITYENIKDYVGQSTSYYTIKGVLVNWMNNPEIKLTEKHEWLSKHEDNVTTSVIKDYFPMKASVSALYEESKTILLNKGGNGLGNLVAFKGQYLAKMDDSILLFGDQNNTVQLHGTNKIGNAFTLGETYVIYGYVNDFVYRPAVQYVASERISVTEEKISVDLSKFPTNTATNLYSIKYTKDSTSHQTSYENAFKMPFVFEGYANSYVKNGKEYVVLDDTFKTSTYSSYTSALNAKALFVQNKEEQALVGEDHSLLYKYITDEPILIRCVIQPYLLNSQHYWQGYVITSTLEVVE